MTAAAKLPTCFESAAALPLAEAPEPDEAVGEDVLTEPVAVAKPVEMAAPVVAEVTTVVVQLQSELYTAVVYRNAPPVAVEEEEPVVVVNDEFELAV